MSTINLMLLGLLLDKSMSAYEIAQILDSHIGRLIKISAPAVYKNIKKLHKDGYCTVEVVKEGEMPEKKIYSITEEGKTYFFELMRYYSENLKDHYFDFNAFLIHLDKVDKQSGLKMLENLEKQFCDAYTWMTQHEEEAIAAGVTFSQRIIIKQYRMIFSTFVEWSKEVVEEYRREQP